MAVVDPRTGMKLLFTADLVSPSVMVDPRTGMKLLLTADPVSPSFVNTSNLCVIFKSFLL